MQFASPAMLIGLGLCLVPVLIHLLSRARRRPERWAAMPFLRAAIAQRSRQMRLESLLLLLARTLLLALLATALAEPAFESARTTATARQPLQTVIVWDASASMGRSDGRQRAIDRARREVDRLLDAALPGDAFQLVRIVAGPPFAVIRRATFDPEEVRTELDRSGLTAQRGEVAGALQSAADLLRQTPDPARKEVVIVSDMQRSNWLPAGETARARLQQALRDLSRQASTRIIDVGAASTGNLAVVGLEAERPLAAPGESFRVLARVRNFGSAAVASRIEWRLQGELRDVVPFEVDADSEAILAFTAVAPSTWACEVEARLPLDDELTIDNRRWTSTPVRDALRALLIEGRPSLAPMQGAADFVRVALAPRRSARSSAAGTRAAPRRLPILPEIRPEAALAELDLDALDLLWLCDVARVPEDQQRRIAAWVERGGGLIVSAGEQLDLASYNQWTAADGRPFLPVALEPGPDLSAADPPYTTWEITDPPHPIVRPFFGRPDSSLSTTLARRWLRGTLRPEVDPRVVARFAQGDPAIVEGRHGVGRVLATLTSADERWGSWAVWPSFVPLVHQLAGYAAAGRWEASAATVGQSLERRLPPGDLEVEATLTTPQGGRQSLPIRCDERLCRAQLPPLTEPGIYRLEYGPPRNRSESLAVNVDMDESGPGRASESELLARLPPRSSVTWQTEWSGVVDAAPSASAPGSLSGMLLGAALATALVELLLAWRSRWGLLGMAGCGLAAAGLPAARGNPAVAFGLVLLISAAAVPLWLRLSSGNHDSARRWFAPRRSIGPRRSGQIGR